MFSSGANLKEAVSCLFGQEMVEAKLELFDLSGLFKKLEILSSLRQAIEPP